MTPLVNILHITDPHLFADKAKELRGVVTYESFASVLDHVRAGDWQAEFILLTGDLVQDDSAEAYGHFRPLLKPLGIPVLCLPGNHDIRRIMKDKLSRQPFHYCESVTADAWRIICVDSCKPGSAAGRVSAAELARLEKELKACESPNALVCLHHPPVATGSAWLDSVGLENADELLELMAAYDRVRTVLAGHVHQSVDQRIGSLRVIATPSTCRQFKPASDTFDVDDNPPAYRRITLHRDGRFGSELVWVN